MPLRHQGLTSPKANVCYRIKCLSLLLSVLAHNSSQPLHNSKTGRSTEVDRVRMSPWSKSIRKRQRKKTEDRGAKRRQDKDKNTTPRSS